MKIFSIILAIVGVFALMGAVINPWQILTAAIALSIAGVCLKSAEEDAEK